MVFSFFGGIVFVNNVLAIGSKNPEIDVFKVPFVASVWGTVSDWAMVLVTTLTAIFLIRTFWEQKRANDILANKDKREVMPRFSVTSVATLDDFSKQYFIAVNLEDNVAYNVTTTFTDKSYQVLEVDFFLERQPNSEFSIPIENEKIEKTLSFTPVMFMSIKFNDIDGREYTQFVSRSFSNFIISWPKESL